MLPRIMPPGITDSDVLDQLIKFDSKAKKRSTDVEWFSESCAPTGTCSEPVCGENMSLQRYILQTLQGLPALPILISIITDFATHLQSPLHHLHRNRTPF